MATAEISMADSNLLNSEVTLTLSISPKTTALYLATLMSCVATVYTANYSVVLSLHVFVVLANWANIMLQRRWRSDLFFITNNKIIPVDSLPKLALTCPSDLKSIISKDSFEFPEWESYVVSRNTSSNRHKITFSAPLAMRFIALGLLQLTCFVCTVLVQEHIYLYLGLELVFIWSAYTFHMMFLTRLWGPNNSAYSKQSEEKSDEPVDNKQEQDNKNASNCEQLKEDIEDGHKSDNNAEGEGPKDENSAVAQLKEEIEDGHKSDDAEVEGTKHEISAVAQPKEEIEDGHKSDEAEVEGPKDEISSAENWCQVDEGEWEEGLDPQPRADRISEKQRLEGKL